MSAAGATAKNGTRNGRAPPFGLFERSVAGRYLMAKRAHGGVALISIISFLGILAAVFVLITAMSVFNGFRHDLLERLLGAQGHIYVHTSITDVAEADALAAELAQVPGVVRSAPVISGQAGVAGKNAFSGIQIFGVSRRDLESLDIIREALEEGQGGIEGFDEGEGGAYTIIIGRQLATKLGVGVGDPVRLLSPSCAPTLMSACTPRQATYYVGGVFSVGMSLIDKAFVYMPIEEASRFLGRSSARYVELSLANPDDIDAVRPDVAEVARGVGVLRDWRDSFSGYVEALDLQRNVVRLILALLVVIAALNIISGLVMLAKNKGGDIAILRTVGASQGSVMRIFFMMGAAIGVLGTTAGLILGTLFCANIGAVQKALEWVFQTKLWSVDVYFLEHVPARVEWREVAITALLSFAASCVATLLPAWNAARLDPVEALRYG
jgi:lipoprotein-releasing system permease protein